MKIRFGRLVLGALLCLALVGTAGCGGDNEAQDTAAGAKGTTKSGSTKSGATSSTKSGSTSSSTKSGSTTAGTKGGTGSSGGAQTAKGPMLKVGETGALGGVKFTLVKAEREQPKGQTLGGDSKREYLLLNLKVENTGTKSVALTSLSTFKLEDPSGNLFSYSMQSGALRDAKLDGPLTAGKDRDGWVGFMVTPADGDWTLVVKLPGQTADVRFRFSYPE